MDKPSIGSDGIALMAISYFSKWILESLGNIYFPSYIYYLIGGGGFLSLAYWIMDTYWIDADKRFQMLFEGMDLANELGKYPKLISTEKNDFGHDYIFSLPEGISIKEFQEHKLAFEQSLDAKITFEYKDKNIIVKCLEEKLEEEYPFVPMPTTHPCEFYIGHTAKGLKKMKLDRHMLIAGTSGFGKSTFERGIITTLIRNNKPEHLTLNLTDFKRNELGIFKNSNMVSTFNSTEEELEHLLTRLGNESKRRYDLFEKEGVLDIERYNKRHPDQPMKYIINFYDEIAQLEGNDEIMTMFQKRLSIDRAAGIFHVMCTQRPSADLLPGKIKANLDIRIAFKTVDSTNSWIVLDQKETAEYLTIKGRGLLKYNDLEEFQAMYLTEDLAVELVKNTFIDKSGEISHNNSKEVCHDNRKRPKHNKPFKKRW